MGTPAPPKLIATYTDFGAAGPYTGQMLAVLRIGAPDIPCVELLNSAPKFAPKPSAYLLAALADQMPPGTLFLCVVDPGVGGARKGLVVRTANHWFVGPDNGLLALASRNAPGTMVWEIDWSPQELSASFHGRDLFAPVAMHIARGETVPGRRLALDSMVGWDWEPELPEVLFVDGYGNLFTGLRAAKSHRTAILRVGQHRLVYARTFCEVESGAGFWYRNSCGLVEIAVNGGSAAEVLGIRQGDPVFWDRDEPDFAL